MDTILKYLRNPMEIGVYCSKWIVDFSSLLDYLEELIEKHRKSQDKKIPGKGRRTTFLQARLEDRLASLKENLTELKDQSWYTEGVFDVLMRSLREFAQLDEAPKAMRDLFYEERESRFFAGRMRRVRRRIPNIFESRIIREANDVLVIEKKHISGKKWYFETISVMEDGTTSFKNRVQCILPPKQEIEPLRERQQFSQRYVLRPYPWAVELWLRNDISLVVPPDLKSFLLGAIRYISSSEWRTSIVLSAITVENILADLYEEKYKDPAPDMPLGNLYKEVGKKIGFPPEIQKAIELVNQTRIAAVHRSRLVISNKEAIDALFGATNLTLWYSVS